MLFNRETDYAIRVIRNLSTDQPKSISSIVKNEYISEAIAYKVSRKLEKGGLIIGVRGSNGGYKLVRPLSEITLYDIYRIMEPNSYVSECLRGNSHCPNNEVNTPCMVHAEFARIQDDLFKNLNSRSIADILNN
ncbi:RrF2 family transcriptional regulator [Alterileibacterium massiliense]|uniref:RrF2 family transcriptional regulator n=1 Tax=Alterileibacterium massiliense TaxID=1870997 RepID=UPI0008DA408C|nr:Rrf2 family transcriptional regulator [Alterileibacterium massiliense]